MVRWRDARETQGGGASLRPKLSPPMPVASPSQLRTAFFWQSGVRTPPPVSTKRQLSVVPPRSCANRAPTHTRRPVPAETTSVIHQLGPIGNFPAAGTTEASAHPSHRGDNFERNAGSRNISHASTQLDRHGGARAASQYMSGWVCASSIGTAHCLRIAPAPQRPGERQRVAP